MKRERPDAPRLAAWLALLDAYTGLTSRLEAELQRAAGISLAEYEVLMRLNGASHRRLRLSELTSCARMTKSGVSRLVDRLEGDGLVETQRCPSDGRGAFAVLTPDGRRRFRRAAAVHLQGVQQHFGRHLDDAKAEAVRSALALVVSELPAGPCSGATHARAASAVRS